MHIGQVAKMLSQELSIKHSAVEAVAQRLRDAGHIRKGARGRNAPHITDLETARLLIALMSSESPAGAAQRCEFFASLPLQPRVSAFPSSWTLNEDRDTFEQHLAALLRFLRLEPEQSSAVYISMEIYLGMAEIVYDDTPRIEDQHFHTRFEAPVELPFEDRHPYLSGVHRIAQIVGPALAKIATRVDVEEN